MLRRVLLLRTQRRRTPSSSRGATPLPYALQTASYLVTSNVREECYQNLLYPGFPNSKVSDPSGLNGGWVFMSLYGAMYLQMAWVMAAGGNVTRCKYCSRIISLTSPLPGGARKTRQDKKFCDNACRQRHHYHTKTKPKR